MTDHDTQGGVDRRGLIASGVGGMAALGLLAAASPAEAGATDATFYDYPPERLADSRSGLRTARAKIRGGQTRTIGVPFFVSGRRLSALLNVTLMQTEGAGWFSLYQTGLNRPSLVTSVSWGGTGQTNTTLVVCGLQSSPPAFNLYCGGRPTTAAHFGIDVVGYFLT